MCFVIWFVNVLILLINWSFKIVLVVIRIFLIFFLSFFDIVVVLDLKLFNFFERKVMFWFVMFWLYFESLRR